MCSELAMVSRGKGEKGSARTRILRRRTIEGFSFLWPQCLLQARDPTQSTWSIFRALIRLTKNKKQILFCFMVLSLGVRLAVGGTASTETKPLRHRGRQSLGDITYALDPTMPETPGT